MLDHRQPNQIREQSLRHHLSQAMRHIKLATQNTTFPGDKETLTIANEQIKTILIDLGPTCAACGDPILHPANPHHDILCDTCDPAYYKDAASVLEA